MQKKIIALAVAGLVSGGAFAQASNVTIYGTLDVGLQTMSTGFGSKTSVVAGGLTASRLGFKGEEALGGGMKAIWTLETGLAQDNGIAGGANQALGANQANSSSTVTGGSQFFSRTAWAGLAGGFGELTFGRQYTSSYLGAAAVIDPVGGGLYANGAQIAGGGMQTRVNNSVVYKTPTMAGFKAHFTWTAGLENNVNTEIVSASATGAACVPGAAVVCSNDKAGRGWDLGVGYGAGPLNALVTTWSNNGVSYAAGATPATLETGLVKNTGWLLGANYDFKVAKIHAGYISSKKQGGNYENVTVALNKSTAYMLSAVVPAGGGKVVANYLSFNDKSVFDRDLSAWSIGYLYDLSKRTTLYVDYGKLSNNANSASTFINAGDAVGVTSGAAGSPAAPSATAGFDPSGFMVGVRHSF